MTVGCSKSSMTAIACTPASIAAKKLLTCTGLDRSNRYRHTIDALYSLGVKSAYIDGEFCAFNADGVPVFNRLQAAMDEGRTDQLVFLSRSARYCWVTTPRTDARSGRKRHHLLSSRPPVHRVLATGTQRLGIGRRSSRSLSPLPGGLG